MGFKERRQKSRHEFKAEILAAAMELFAREGYANFSMRKLATRIDHSPTTIYLYFRDKDDLLFHICEDLYATLLQNQQQLLCEGTSPEQALRALFWDYINYSLSNPEQYKVVFFSNPYLYGSPDEYTQRDTMSLRYWKSVCAVIEQCMQNGVFRPMNVDTFSIVLWSAVHGLVSSLIFTKDFPMPDQNEMAEMLLEGLFSGYR